MSLLIQEARRVFDIEAQAILDLKEKVNSNFEAAVNLIMDTRGKVVVTGMGKSGQIARKIASTFSSTGTPAVFAHPGEMSHGDLGIMAAHDMILALSYRGETDELRDLLGFAKRKGLKVVALTGNMQSTLAQTSDIVLDVGIKQEACPLGLAPTASTTAALAMGDALAVAVLTKRGFKEEDFAEYHPGGSLGRKLLTRVKDLMHAGERIPIVKPETGMREILTVMTSKEVRGICGVVNSEGGLIGAITDGDIRRRLEKSKNLLEEKAKDLMSQNPKIIDQSELAERALFLMEQFVIQSLFVVDKAKSATNPVGIIHLQDLLRARIR